MGQRSQIYVIYKDNQNRDCISATYFQWNYGERKSRDYGRNTYGSGSYYDSPVSTYKDIAAASSRGVSSTFHFRSADRFLNSLNKNKNTDVDLAAYKAGVKVYHKKFGEGVINSVETEGEDLKVDINFEKAGHKRLMAKFAGLEIIE